jgi:hypothetical protein
MFVRFITIHLLIAVVVSAMVRMAMQLIHPIRWGDDHRGWIHDSRRWIHDNRRRGYDERRRDVDRGWNPQTDTHMQPAGIDRSRQD